MIDLTLTDPAWQQDDDDDRDYASDDEASPLTAETLARAIQDATGLVVASTGEHLPAIDTDRSTVVQIETWLVAVRTAVEDMATVNELNQAEAMLTAVAKRLKQLGQDAAETERVRILTFKRIGDLIGPAERGNPRPETGRGSMSQDCDIERSGVARNRDWQARKVAEHWETVEPPQDERNAMPAAGSSGSRPPGDSDAVLGSLAKRDRHRL